VIEEAKRIAAASVAVRSRGASHSSATSSRSRDCLTRKRPESARQSYGIEAVNEFDPIFEDVYDWCAVQEIDILIAPLELDHVPVGEVPVGRAQAGFGVVRHRQTARLPQVGEGQ
jgi:hypothetical protein